jgi:hypothetical protein
VYVTNVAVKKYRLSWAGKVKIISLSKICFPLRMLLIILNRILQQPVLLIEILYSSHMDVCRPRWFSHLWRYDWWLTDRQMMKYSWWEQVPSLKQKEQQEQWVRLTFSY